MRGMVYDSWPKASKALPNESIVPLTNLPNKLLEEVLIECDKKNIPVLIDLAYINLADNN